MISKIVFTSLIVLELVMIGIMANAGTIRTMDTVPWLISILNLIPLIVFAIRFTIGIGPDQSGYMEMSNYLSIQQIRKNTDRIK